MTKLHITETVIYVVDIAGGPYEAMRVFLNNPGIFLYDVQERNVDVMDDLDFDALIEANEEIARAEGNS
jgi:hypothetical protein